MRGSHPPFSDSKSFPVMQQSVKDYAALVYGTTSNRTSAPPPFLTLFVDFRLAALTAANIQSLTRDDIAPPKQRRGNTGTSRLVIRVNDDFTEVIDTDIPRIKTQVARHLQEHYRKSQLLCLHSLTIHNIFTQAASIGTMKTPPRCRRRHI